MPFEDALKVVLKHEGGYVNHPADPGGATNKGITTRVYHEYLATKGLPPADVKHISNADVADIYRTQYWNTAKCDVLPEPMATFQFDSAVNHGVNKANWFLANSRGDPAKYLELREDFYRHLARTRPAMQVFLKGWLKRIDSLRGLL